MIEAQAFALTKKQGMSNKLFNLIRDDIKSLVELQEYKKELQRQEGLVHRRRLRNIRLVSYVAACKTVLSNIV